MLALAKFWGAHLFAAVGVALADEAQGKGAPSAPDSQQTSPASADPQSKSSAPASEREEPPPNHEGKSTKPESTTPEEPANKPSSSPALEPSTEPASISEKPAPPSPISEEPTSSKQPAAEPVPEPSSELVSEQPRPNPSTEPAAEPVSEHSTPDPAADPALEQAPVPSISEPAPDPAPQPIPMPVSEPVPEQPALDRAVESDFEPATMQVPESATTSKSVARASTATEEESVATELEAVSESLTGKMLRLVDGLLHSRSERATDLPAQVSSSVIELVGLVAELHGGLLEGGKAPSAADTPSAPAVLESMAVAILRWVEGLLSGDVAPISVDDLPPTPAAPVPPVPPVASPTGTSLSASRFFDSAYLMLVVLTSFSILLLEGRFSWPFREFLRPSSALPLALERPG